MSSDHVTIYKNLPLFGPVHTEAIDRLLFLKGFSLESFLIPKAKRIPRFSLEARQEQQRIIVEWVLGSISSHFRPPLSLWRMLA